MFKTQKLELKGFKGGVFYLKELSISQTKEVSKCDGDDLDTLLVALKHSLIDEDGKKVVTPEYTAENLCDDLPQSYLNKIADAYVKLNTFDEIETAKK